MSPTSSVSRTGEYAERGDYHRHLSTDWEFYPDLSRQARARPRATSPRCRAARACSTPAAAKACSSTSSTIGSRSTASIPTTAPSASRADRSRALPYRGGVVRSRAVPRRARAPDVRRAAAGAGGAVSRDRARRRAARHGAEPRAPAVARALPAARPADSHREPRQASGRSAGRRVSRSGARAPGSGWSSAAASSRPCRCSRAGFGASPARLRWLHRLLTRLLPVPGWCFLNVLRFERP